MKTFTQNLLKWLLVVEFTMFLSVYFFGPHGMQLLYSMEKENNVLENTIQKLNNEITELTTEIALFEQYDFYKEKIAREQLQMARKGETIYVYS
jgi:cell division protein FtsB